MPPPSRLRTALITGASAGLGTEFAKLFAKDGHNVILVTRREERLQSLAKSLEGDYGIAAIVIGADLAKPEAPRQLFEGLKNKKLRVDYLVNNAAFGTRGVFSELRVQRELDMIQVNITALTALSRIFASAMLDRGYGRILNVASLAAFAPGPYMTTYYATKAYVLSFSEALAYELRHTGVTATACCPGPTVTELTRTAGSKQSALLRAAVADSSAVAKHAYRAMHAGKVIAIPGLLNKFLVQMLRITPRSWARGITAYLNRSP
ncbi:MAG: SDR family oxidoreductase [Myxococcota bacterium]